MRLVQLVTEPVAAGVVVVVSVLLWLTGLQDTAGANSRSQLQRCYQPGGHSILRVDLRNGQGKVQSVFSFFSPSNVRDQFASNVRDQFPSNVRDQFPSNVRDQFPSNVRDQFPSNVRDQFASNVRDQFP